MKETTQLLILFCVLLALASGFSYITIFHTNFTFSSSKIELNGNQIKETLVYNPHSDYHTLYRNFITPIRQTSLNYDTQDSITVTDVKCSDGTAYYTDYLSYLNIFYLNNVAQSQHTLANTESNEYGCGFGDVTGFKSGNEYTISAQYTLNPKTLTEYNGRHYIKFVVYSANLHPFFQGSNIDVGDGAIYSHIVFPNEDVIIYIPYEPSNINQYNIIQTNSLDTQNSRDIIILICIFLPIILCIIVWIFFGKENVEGDYPEELSQYPKERKVWEVSAYFHPPFGNLDQNFMPAMMLDFYNRKIIDLDFRKSGLLIKTNDIYIKILDNKKDSKEQLDDIETEFINYLKKIRDIDPQSDGYFSIRNASMKFLKGAEVTLGFKNFKKTIKKKSKDYLSYNGVYVAMIALGIPSFIAAVMTGYKIYVIIIVALIGYVVAKTSLYIKFKGDNYKEFQLWQGFRKFLSNSDAMKTTPPKGVVMWNKYLVYATAMGVGKEVLKQMKDLNIINQQSYNNFTTIYTANAFGGASGASSGGGAGGMGGGGIGGGGGGGR